MNKIIKHNGKIYRIHAKFSLTPKVEVDGVECEVHENHKHNLYYCKHHDGKETMMVLLYKHHVYLHDIDEDTDIEALAEELTSIKLSFFESLLIGLLCVLPMAMIAYSITVQAPPYILPFVSFLLCLLMLATVSYFTHHPELTKTAKRLWFYLGGIVTAAVMTFLALICLNVICF